MDQYSPLLQKLLAARGIHTKEDAQVFLNPDFDTHTHDPALFADMDVAVARVFRAIDNQERIAVYADFDCDGIPGAVVLADFFRKIGYENVEVYIPHRDREGYGFHTSAIDTLAGRGVSLIITVDVGTVATDAVSHANSAGVDVIVTDHHELPADGTLPPAAAVINPKRAPYPFPDLCGAAVAWKLVVALIAEGKRQERPAFTAILDGWEKWLLDMVGIATVADMVPLVGENRTLAFYGLAVLRKSPRPGLAALLRAVRADQTQLTEDDIGFLIGPRINAASRMDAPELAFHLLATQDPREAEALAARLESLNRKRKGAVASIVREARKRLRERAPQDAVRAPVTVLGDPAWKPALLGLAANSLLDDCGGIVCMWGRDAPGTLKGSCRSDGSRSVVELFTAAQDALEGYGGHHASGGFSVAADQVHTLGEQFAAAARSLAAKDRAEAAAFDHETAAALVAESLWRELSQLAPFGMGNPKPILALPGVEVTAVRSFGKASEHIELTVGDGNGAHVKAIQFFADPEQWGIQPEQGTRVTLLGTLDRSVFRGVTELRLRIVNVVSHE